MKDNHIASLLKVFKEIHTVFKEHHQTTDSYDKIFKRNMEQDREESAHDLTKYSGMLHIAIEIIIQLKDEVERLKEIEAKYKGLCK